MELLRNAKRKPDELVLANRQAKNPSIPTTEESVATDVKNDRFIAVGTRPGSIARMFTLGRTPKRTNLCHDRIDGLLRVVGRYVALSLGTVIQTFMDFLTRRCLVSFSECKAQGNGSRELATQRFKQLPLGSCRLDEFDCNAFS